jgi:putative peptide zinc metalloprotease protein
VHKRELSPLSAAPAPRLTARLRKDVKITSRPARGTRPGNSYLVEDPATGENFSFGEEEHFLCQAMDGMSTSEEILARFSRRFGLEMTEERFRSFEEHLLAMGLAENVDPVSEPVAKIAEPPPSAVGPSADTEKSKLVPGWKICNPARFFLAAYGLVRPFSGLSRILVLALIPGVPMALYVIFRHDSDFRLDLRTTRELLGYLGGLLFGLIAANLVRCIVQGIVCTHYQVVPQAFGIKLRRGVFPRFYIDKSKVRGLDRSAKLWIYGTSLLLRLFFIAGGTLLWMLYKDSHTLVPLIAVTLAQTGLIGLVLQLLPVNNHDGYRWLITFFNLPPKMIGLAGTVFKYRIQGKPLPDSLAGGRGTRFLLYAVFLIVAITYGGYKIAVALANALTEAFPDIMGRATWYIFFGGLGYFVFRWAMGRFAHQSSTSATRDDDAFDLQEAEDTAESVSQEATEGFWKSLQQHRAIVLSIAACLFLLIPFAYRPGGEIQVLPPIQQQIQAPISGKVAEIPFEGGDGKLIPKGTVVAKMISSEIENQILTLEQSRAQQVSTIDKLKSELAKLVAGAREEEIAAGRASLQQADEEVKIATQELEAAKVSAAYSEMVLPRMKQLYGSGSIALLQYEEAKKMADLDKISVEKQQKNLASLERKREESQAQLDLLRSGARPEDIDAARHSVQAAEADLSRIEQQIQFARQQQTESALLMPFDGYLVDSHLDFKKGSHLLVGEVYATAQNNSEPLVEVQLPEYDMEGVEVGAQATVKLYAYPNTPLNGTVLSIQPAALPSSTEEEAVSMVRIFQVLIKVDKAPVAFKAGMTGYAKISAGFQPLGFLLARPMLRFIQIEVWSWLP